jgi:hypothetical protein
VPPWRIKNCDVSLCLAALACIRSGCTGDPDPMACVTAALQVAALFCGFQGIGPPWNTL